MRIWPRFVALSAILTLFSPVFAEEAELQGRTQILYLLKGHEADKAFSLYQKMTKGVHDIALLEQMATILLQQGVVSHDPEIQLLTLHGASMAHFQCPLYVLETGLLSHDPYVQAGSIQALAQIGEDGTDELLSKAMHSPFLMIRIHAAHALSQRGYKKAVGPIESLMLRLPGPAWVFFPEFYAMLGNKQAIAILKSLTHHPVTEVRLSAVYHAAKHRRDDLLPAIRSMATHMDPSEQEMAAFALGTFHDMASKEQLLKLKESKDSSVALSAAHALRHLGDPSAITFILDQAAKRNPFAIDLLSHYDEGEQLLHQLVRDADPQIRLQTVLTLLKRKDPIALASIGEFLLRDHRDIGFIPISSLGRTLRTWRITPLVHAKAKNEESELATMALALREEMLTACLELNESLFLMIARKVLDNEQIELIPLLVQLLQNLDSTAAKKLLHERAQSARLPLIRAYCNLTLYRIKDPNFDEKALFTWINQEMDHHLIQFRAKESTNKQERPEMAYQLTPQETSRLLIETYQALSERRDPRAVDTLVNAMAIGNPKNRYVLAGLLLIAIQ